MPGHERLLLAEDIVVFVGCVIAPGDAGDDRAIRERRLTFPVGSDGHVVTQDRPDVVECAFFPRHGNQAPVAVTGR